MRTLSTKTCAISYYNGLGDQLYDIAGERPTLDLNFASNKSLVDSVTGKTLVTHTRASNATYVDGDGIIKDAVTNLLLRSEDFSTTWSTSDTSVSTNQTTAPDGTTTADKLICGTGTPIFQGITQTFTATTAATRFSVYVKAGELNQVELRTFNPTEYAIFNLSDGTVAVSSGDPDASIVDAGNGWYRCSISAPDTGVTSARISLADGDSRTFTPVTDAGIYVWGAQLEANSYATSYIPTYGSTATRAADVSSSSSNTFGNSFYNQTEGTVFSDLQTLSATPDHYSNVFELQKSDNTDRLFVRYPNFSGWEAGGQTNLNLSRNFAQQSKLAIGYKTNDTNFAANGSGTTDSSVTIGTTKDEFYIGESGSGNALNGTIRRLTVWPTRLSNDTLQTITT